MNTKQKIALSNLKQDLEREIISEDQARAKFREIMGQDADDVTEEELESATVLGKSQDSSDEDLEETTQPETHQETQQVDLVDSDQETKSTDSALEEIQEVSQSETPENTRQEGQIDQDLEKESDEVIQEVIPDEAPETTVDLSLNPPTDKMIEKRLTKAKKPKQ